MSQQTIQKKIDALKAEKRDSEQALAARISQATGESVEIKHNMKYSKGRALYITTKYHVAGLVLTTGDAKAKDISFYVQLPTPWVKLDVLGRFIKTWNKALDIEMEE